MCQSGLVCFPELLLVRHVDDLFHTEIGGLLFKFSRSLTYCRAPSAHFPPHQGESAAAAAAACVRPLNAAASP